MKNAPLGSLNHSPSENMGKERKGEIICVLQVEAKGVLAVDAAWRSPKICLIQCPGPECAACNFCKFSLSSGDGAQSSQCGHSQGSGWLRGNYDFWRCRCSVSYVA